MLLWAKNLYIELPPNCSKNRQKSSFSQNRHSFFLTPRDFLISWKKKFDQFRHLARSLVRFWWKSRQKKWKFRLSDFLLLTKVTWTVIRRGYDSFGISAMRVLDLICYSQVAVNRLFHAKMSFKHKSSRKNQGRNAWNGPCECCTRETLLYDSIWIFMFFICKTEF